MEDLLSRHGRTNARGGRTAGRAAIYAAIAFVAFFPPAYMVFWLFADPEVCSSGDKLAGPPEAPASPEAVESVPSVLPASEALLSSALEAIWKGEKSETEGISIDDGRREMEKSLKAAFPEPPSSIHILYSPARCTAGSFTLRVTDTKGREGLVLVRLVPRPGEANPWLVESLSVVSYPR